MSHHRGPKTITQDLIFHYDTGNEKSFAGEPTTNLLYSAGAYNLIDGATDIYGRCTKTDLGNGKYRFVNNGTGVSTVRVYVNQSNLINGATYACSVYFEDLIGSISIDWCDTGITGINYSTNPSGRLGGYGTRATYDGPYYFLDINFDSGGSVTLFNPQVEYKSHVTPFVNGTRSNTQALLDLSKRSVMTVANASFDSNAMLNFDGTNDYIQLTSFTQPTNYITCEAWINPQDLVTPGTIRGGVISSTNSMYLGIFDSYDGTTFGSHWAVQTSTGARPSNVNGSIPRNKWTHLVGTYNGSVSRTYINGVEVWNSPLTGTIPSATYYIGTYGGTIVDDTHNFNGYISVAKIYNRALTAEQVYQNYNASKSRFGL
jgi:hypothetical protein